MEHREIIEALAESVGGGVELQEADGLREHLEQCGDCRAWAEDYRLFADALAGMAAEHPSSDELGRRAVDPAMLTVPERLSIDRHLAACPECRRQLKLTMAALAGARRDGATAVSAQSLPLRLAIAAGLILAVALGFTLRRSPPPGLTADRVLVAQSLTGTRLVDAAGSITATAVTIESGGDVVFRAGDAVILGSGFSVATNASLEVAITAPSNP